MKYLETFLKVSFSKDFYITEKLLKPVAIIGAIASPVFYYLCTYLGFWDSLHIRITSSIILFPLIFFSKILNTFQKIYYEVAVLLVMPVVFTFFYLMNLNSVYWVASFIWAGIFYGLFSSKMIIAILLFPVGFLGGILLYWLYTGSPFVAFNEIIGIFFIAWFSALVLGIMKLVTNVFYLLSLDSESMRILAGEAQKRKSVFEKKNIELLSRNMIISTFVRPSILKEVNMGKDPRAYRPRIVEKAILICDMRNFTPLTSIMNNAEVQAQFINKYFEMMINPVFEAGGEVDKLMGDAVMAIFPDGLSAVTAALKMRTLLQSYNERMIYAGLNKIRNVISISKGATLEANIGAEQKLDRTYIGAAVNVCSRLEHIAKLYDLEIIITKEIFDDLEPNVECCRFIDIVKVKGYDKKLKVFEMYTHNPKPVIEYKNSIDDLLQQGILLYFKKDLSGASKIFKKLLQNIPQHTCEPGKVMDGIVRYYATRCAHLACSKGSVELLPTIEEGCHDFIDLLSYSVNDIATEELIERL